MTIQIYEKSGRYLPLYFPIGFVRTELGSRLLAKIILQAVSQKGRTNGRAVSEKEAAALGPKDSWPGWLDEQVLCRLLRALGRCLGCYRGLTLAEAEPADGDFVRIVL